MTDTCSNCGIRPSREGCKRCDLCMESTVKAQRKGRKRKKREGACQWCSKAAIPGKVYCESCQEKASERNARRLVELRNRCYAAYGGKCVCCGEMEESFLTLDHVHGDGAQDRRKHPSHALGLSLYRRLEREGYPDTFQLLCYNCNCGRHRNGGVCPHELSTVRRLQ